MKKENTKEVLMGGGLSFLKFEKIEKNSSKL
ncbi:Uncharacterised protein [Campylobacter jejuni subsp. doylei]|nr:Uncharacterised protein [Campylobacter jejuni subsp. doylei]